MRAAADSVGEHRHVGPRRADSAAKQKEAKQKEAKQKEARQKEAKQIEARQKEAKRQEAKRQEAKRQEAKRQEAKGRAAASRPATLEPAPVRPAPGLSSRASSQRTPPPHTSSQLEEPSRSSAGSGADRLLGARSPLHASPDDHLDALDIGLGCTPSSSILMSWLPLHSHPGTPALPQARTQSLTAAMARAATR